MGQEVLMKKVMRVYRLKNPDFPVSHQQTGSYGWLFHFESSGFRVILSVIAIQIRIASVSQFRSGSHSCPAFTIPPARNPFSSAPGSNTHHLDLVQLLVHLVKLLVRCFFRCFAMNQSSATSSFSSVAQRSRPLSFFIV